MMDSTSILSNTSGQNNDLKRDPLQSPVFKLRGLEMTVYGLEKENLELRQRIETQEKEINNYQKLISDFENENDHHERRHAQLEEEILELRKQLKQYCSNSNHTNTSIHINNNNNNNNNHSNNNNNSNSLEKEKEKDKLLSDDLYLYTGRSLPNNSPSNALTNSTSFNSNHSYNLNESNGNNNNNNSNNNNNHTDHLDIPLNHPGTPTITTNNNNNNNNGGSTRSPFQKGNNGKPPSSPTIVSILSDGVNTGVNISMSPSPVIPQPRKKSIISLFSL